ncbi:MAG: hypothetical protein KGL11_15365 [Alphaproteobacteria bacterium]|nr:hypothetical protein [Alphaproteobacteria bacterium]
MSGARYGIAILAFVLVGCSDFAPFETMTPNLGPGAQRREPAQQTITAAGANPANAPVSVCYSRLAATPAQVTAVAAEECGKGEAPELVDQGVDLMACPVLIPTRATFRCIAH